MNYQPLCIANTNTYDRKLVSITYVFKNVATSVEMLFWVTVEACLNVDIFKMTKKKKASSSFNQIYKPLMKENLQLRKYLTDLSISSSVSLFFKTLTPLPME